MFIKNENPFFNEAEKKRLNHSYKDQIKSLREKIQSFKNLELSPENIVTVKHTFYQYYRTKLAYNNLTQGPINISRKIIEDKFNNLSVFSENESKIDNETLVKTANEIITFALAFKISEVVKSAIFYNQIAEKLMIMALYLLALLIIIIGTTSPLAGFGIIPMQIYGIIIGSVIGAIILSFCAGRAVDNFALTYLKKSKALEKQYFPDLDEYDLGEMTVQADVLLNTVLKDFPDLICDQPAKKTQLNLEFPPANKYALMANANNEEMTIFLARKY